MRKSLTMLILLFICGSATARQHPGNEQKRMITFRFVAGDDMFYVRSGEPVPDNAWQLQQLFDLVDEYRAEISTGIMPVYVDGYSLTKRLSFIRANRVKSELITHKGLTEDNFITGNHAGPYTAFDGTVYKNIVVVTLCIPVKPEERPDPEHEYEPKEEPARAEDKPYTVVEPQPEAAPVPTASWWRNEPYRLAVRTNLLYDGFGLPTLGLEYRVSRHMGIKLDGSRSWWSGGDNGKVQKIWLLSPEVRWYLLDKRFYVGASANYGEYNIYKYPVGGLFSSGTGYQGKLWNAGATVGYQLYLSGSLTLDFNVGLGYTHSSYDSFTIEDGQRTYKDRDRVRTLWGPTQAGVSLVWTLGSKK